MDFGRISSRRWAIALLVFLCVSAVLFIAPWILSAFYESDPYETWNEEARFTIREKQGNVTLLCTAAPCVACTSGEKEDASLKCSPTGYHKAQKCLEDGDEGKGSQDVTTDPVQSGDEKNSAGEEKKRMIVEGKTEGIFEVGGISRRRLNVAEDGVQMSIIYKTCIPQEVKEKLSVFGFEGVVLLCLLVSAPAVHYRKNRGAPSPGLQRIPSNARF